METWSARFGRVAKELKISIVSVLFCNLVTTLTFMYLSRRGQGKSRIGDRLLSK